MLFTFNDKRNHEWKTLGVYLSLSFSPWLQQQYIATNMKFFTQWANQTSVWTNVEIVFDCFHVKYIQWSHIPKPLISSHSKATHLQNMTSTKFFIFWYTVFKRDSEKMGWHICKHIEIWFKSCCRNVILISKQWWMQFQQKWRLLGLLQPTGTLRVIWCLVTLGDQRGRSYLHSWLFCTHPISCTTVSMPMGDSKRSKSTLEPITFLITTKIQPQLYGRPPPWIIKTNHPLLCLSGFDQSFSL